MRVIVLLLAAFMAFGAMSAMSSVAEAQEAPAQAQPNGVRASVVKKYPHSDRVESKDKGMAL